MMYPLSPQEEEMRRLWIANIAKDITMGCLFPQPIQFTPTELEWGRIEWIRMKITYAQKRELKKKQRSVK